jgi:hypothetical protein
MQAKTTNRLDTSLWLGKRVITFKEPKNWQYDFNYLNNNYVRTNSKKDIYKALKNYPNLINSRKNYLKCLEQKENQSEITRDKILKEFL